MTDTITQLGTTAVAPAAATVVVGPVTPVAGTYTITVKAYLSGTATAADRGNMQVNKNANLLGVIGIPGQTASNSYDPYTQQMKTTFNGTDTCSVVVTANASAAAVYTVVLILDKTGN